MLSSAGWVHSEQIVNYRDRPKRPELDHEQFGYGSLNRLYECSEGGWIMLVARNDKHVSGLAKLADHRVGVLLEVFAPGHRER